MATSEIRTLVVDDHPDIRELLRLILGRSDEFHVVGFGRNGVEAVELAEANQPDLVLLDVLMPVMTGITALPLIRQKAPAAKVVFLTVLDRWLIEGLEPSPEPPDAVLSKAKVVQRPSLAIDELKKVVRR